MLEHMTHAGIICTGHLQAHYTLYIVMNMYLIQAVKQQFVLKWPETERERGGVLIVEEGIFL